MSSLRFWWKVIYRSDVDDRYITLAWKSRTKFSSVVFFISFLSLEKKQKKTRDMASPFEGSSSLFLYNAQLKYVDDSAQQFSLIFLYTVTEYLWSYLLSLISLFLSFQHCLGWGFRVTPPPNYSSTSSSSLVLSDCSRERVWVFHLVVRRRGCKASSYHLINTLRRRKKRFVYTLATVLLL